MTTSSRLPKTKTTTNSTSWADRVRVTDSSTRFTLEPLSRQPIGHILKISEELLLDNSSQWTRCMIGFFPGFRMPFHAVNSIASRAWRSYGLENVMTTSNGFIIFRFNTEDAMHAVLEKGPWMFGGKNIILQQWHPRFQFDKNKISTIPVWIRLHGLPFPLWSKQGLSLAASMVGRPLSCDELTYGCTRLEYARLCVEVDASLPFVHNFDIESPLSNTPITVTVEYEWKPQRCEKCKVFGHSCVALLHNIKETIAATNDSLQHEPNQADPVAITPPIPNAIAPHTDLAIPHKQPPNTTTSTNPSTSIKLAYQQTIPHVTTIPHPSASDQPLPTQKPNSNQASPTTKPHLSMPFAEPAIPTDIENCDSSQDSENELLGLQHHHVSGLHATVCLESKMDSLRTTSATFSTDQGDSNEASTSSIHPADSYVQSPPPTTVKKKKGGKKKKEARGLAF
ncbi:hypothetical protein NC651_004679 [Populus alba x Populus x berolinensis]|nr:hypothetical protein NC651_004679 [Populus alba x Populus x berolinensis]